MAKNKRTHFEIARYIILDSLNTTIAVEESSRSSQRHIIQQYDASKPIATSLQRWEPRLFNTRHVELVQPGHGKAELGIVRRWWWHPRQCSVLTGGHKSRLRLGRNEL